MQMLRRMVFLQYQYVAILSWPICMQILLAYKCYVSARQTAVMQATCMLYVLQINV